MQTHFTKESGLIYLHFMPKNYINEKQHGCLLYNLDMIICGNKWLMQAVNYITEEKKNDVLTIIYRTQVRFKYAKTQNYEQKANECSISQFFLLRTTKAFGKYCIVNHFYFINQRTQ